MHKESSKYIQIDKSIVAEGLVYDFDIYTPSQEDKNKKMQNCISSGVPLTCIETEIINTNKLLYVSESQYPKYEAFKKNFLNAKKPMYQKVQSFEQKRLSVYKNASVVLSKLFDNPEVLSNYQASKEIIQSMVGIVMDKKYTIKSMMSIAAHDYYTHTHSINVAIYSLSLGKFLNLSKSELLRLAEAAFLHDLGKSKIDSKIINKQGFLTDDEFEEVKKHSTFGYTIGLQLGIKDKLILNAIRYHHEKMDGSGYPIGIKKEQIPFYARIISISDIFDALTSKKSYKEPMTSFEALMLMRTTMQHQIDMKLLNKMILMFR